MQDSDRKSGTTEESAPKGPVKRWPLLAIAAVIAVAIIAIVVVLALRGSTEESGPPTSKIKVFIDAPATVAAGGSMTARVAIENVVAYDSAVFDLSYDPGVLELTGITDGSLNTTAVPVDMWDFIPAGIQGQVRIVSNVPGTPGVNGSGYLCEIHFNAIGDSGDSGHIDFTGERSMANKWAAPIVIPDTDWEGDVVTVE